MKGPSKKADSRPGNAVAGAPAPSRALAWWSFGLGVVACVSLGILGLPAVLVGHTAVRRARQAPERYGGAALARIGLVAGYVSCGLLVLALVQVAPALTKAKARAERITCNNNLKQIAVCLKIYSIDNKDTYPVSLLQASNDLNTPKVLICPNERQYRSPATNWETFSPANCSYIFVVPGILEAELAPDKAVAICPIHNLEILGDGSVRTWARQ